MPSSTTVHVEPVNAGALSRRYVLPATLGHFSATSAVPLDVFNLKFDAMSVGFVPVRYSSRFETPSPSASASGAESTFINEPKYRTRHSSGISSDQGAAARSFIRTTPLVV